MDSAHSSAAIRPNRALIENPTGPKSGEATEIQGSDCRTQSGDMQLRGVPNGYRDLFLIDHCTVRAAQLDLVVSGTQRKLLGVL